MKKIALLLLIASSFTLIAAEVPPPASSDTETPPDITTPTWAVDPLAPPVKKDPSPEMMRNKHIAAVMIGTAASVIIGLLVSGANTGKHPAPSSKS